MINQNYILRDTFNNFLKNKFEKQEQYLLNAIFININKTKEKNLYFL